MLVDARPEWPTVWALREHVDRVAFHLAGATAEAVEDWVSALRGEELVFLGDGPWERRARAA